MAKSIELINSRLRGISVFYDYPPKKLSDNPHLIHKVLIEKCGVTYDTAKCMGLNLKQEIDSLLKDQNEYFRKGEA